MSGRNESGSRLLDASVEAQLDLGDGLFRMKVYLVGDVWKECSYMDIQKVREAEKSESRSGLVHG